MGSLRHLDPSDRTQIGSNHGSITPELNLPMRPKTFGKHYDRLLSSSHDKYTIAWICAIHIEMAAARAMLDEIHQSPPAYADDCNTYVLGSIKQHQVVIACLPAEQYGTNNAARVMTNMKRTFPALRAILMVGIGGGVPSRCDLFLGDVVVGTRVMQHDLGKVVGDGKFQRTAIPRVPDMILGTAISALQAKHELAPNRILSILQQRLGTNSKYGLPKLQDQLFVATYDHISILNNSCQGCDHSKLVPRSERRSDDIVVHYGAIASGNQVIKHGLIRDKIARELDVICFEMETAGLMDILPCLAIRGICDYSDSHKNENWQRYAAATAAAYARELIEEIPHTHKRLSSGRRESLLESLRFDNIDSRKLDIKKAHAKTCRWLLSHPNYEEWLDSVNLSQHNGFLWISGKPGVGKSTIMKYAYLNLKRNPRFRSSVIASFFFNARGQSLEKSLNGMYRSLLLQLLEGYPDLQTILDDPDVISQCQNGCPPLNVLEELFSTAISALGDRIFTCFVDAVDECDKRQVMDMVRCFQDLAEQSTAKNIAFRVCFSSRHYPIISIRRGIRLTLEDQQGHTEDLVAYVASRLVVTDIALNKELQSKIIEKAAGVFLWVFLVVDMLNEEDRSRGGMSLRRILAELPTDLSKLFRDLLRRDKDDMEALLLSVIWILYAERPLKPNEYYHAIWSGLSLEGLVDDQQIPDATSPDPKGLTEKFARYISSSSKGLAEATTGNQPTVQFIHQSVRDFLVEDQGLLELWPDIGHNYASLSHQILRQCCRFYLSHSSVRQVVRRLLLEPHSGMRPEILEDYPLLKYANQHILYHANAAAQVCPQDEFLSKFLDFEWIQLNNLFEKFKIRRFSQNTSPFYILAEKGLSELIRTIGHNDSQDNKRQGRYKYPIFAALASGSKETVAAVLGLSSIVHNGIDILEGFESHSPIMGRAKRLYRIVNLLQSEQTINQVDKGGHTPLTRASMNGHESIARTLIEKGAEIEAIDKDRRSPLHLASMNGHEAVARFLIQKGAGVYAKDSEERTSLHLASRNGHEAVARLLVVQGVDIDAIDKYGWTPIHLASMNGHEAMVRLLVAEGAEIEAIDKERRSPLHLASMDGNEAVVRFLIQKGAGVYTKDNEERTSLHLASKNGHEAVARLLVAEGAEIQAIDKDRRSPLHLASKNGHKAVARLLVTVGREIEAIDKDRRSPLHLASMDGHEAVVRFLIAKGADIHVVDRYGWTPIHLVSMEDEGILARININDGFEEVARLLIDKGADINAVDKKGRTPLHHALGHGHKAVARLLEEKGAKAHAIDKDGKSALHFFL
ncbi:Pfs NACHT and ankyrin domain protein [Penicillium sp. IBT 35674x]|nr:Pfs NACHT and ankyrin domain protein [Penicillium sp. IBT 35674x]